jgi:hypothetical protein
MMRKQFVPLVGLCVWFGCVLDAVAIPTPRLSHDEMLKMADVVVEGEVIGVALTKRWIGDRAGIDTGYEQGDFESWFLITKVVKGDYQKDQTVQYFVHGYMEGKWKNPPPMGFVYEGTAAAITPGTKLRVYLKWNAKERRYERVHFNSGFEVLEESAQKYPTKVGAPVFAAESK